jgi:glycosyltransferase involved in cell wall biosynthesis
VTNNFSTGGAQSSARRLLLGLTSQGVPMRAAVIEEHPDQPTSGRLAVIQTGIPVEVLPAGLLENLPAALGYLLRAMDADPPQCVLFWNLRPSVKVGLADALLDLPIFDVSPGEMFFESLDRHFAKADGVWPYRTAKDYGARLAGVIVKYQAEAGRATEALGAPVHVVPNGVPEACGVSPGGLPLVVFGTAARIQPRKRLEDLIDAFRIAQPRLPAGVLRIAGGTEAGCEEYEARLRASSVGLPVEWMGEARDISDFHRGLDVFVMVSEPAGCPNASLEAMASGLPVIATDVGGASEQVLDGRTGRLVPPRDPERLAAAMVELASQPAARRAMGAAARDLIAQRFSLDRMLAGYRRICLEGRPLPSCPSEIRTIAATSHSRRDSSSARPSSTARRRLMGAISRLPEVFRSCSATLRSWCTRCMNTPKRSAAIVGRSRGPVTSTP